MLIHSPHRRTGLPTGRITWSESNAEVATLALNQPVTALVAGKLSENDDKEILVIGSPTHILGQYGNKFKVIFEIIRTYCEWFV